MAWEENSCICLHMQLITILSRIGVKCDISKKTVKTVRLSGFRRNALTYRLFATRQLADKRQVVNCLSVRMLQPKTRWSDSFFGNSCFYWESSILATFTYIYQHNLIPPTSYNYSCMSVRKNRGSQIIIFMWHLIDIQAFLYHSLADAGNRKYWLSDI